MFFQVDANTFDLIFCFDTLPSIVLSGMGAAVARRGSESAGDGDDAEKQAEGGEDALRCGGALCFLLDASVHNLLQSQGMLGFGLNYKISMSYFTSSF